MSQAQFLGTLYTALTTYEYTKLEAEYKARKAAGRPGVEEEWAAGQKAMAKAFAAGGLKNVSPEDLTRFSQAFNASKANRDAVIKIANTARSVGGRGARLGGDFIPTGMLVPTVGKFIETLPGFVFPIPTICSTALVQGSFTKHLGSTVSLTVQIGYPCPTWNDWFKWCTKTVTVATVSWAVDVNVGYKVTCCGATVWGYGSVSACASFLGASVCASCSASIVGVAGVSRTPISGGQCSYGLGITASLKCTLFGVTILSFNVPFGWTIAGPCPPPGLCP